MEKQKEKNQIESLDLEILNFDSFIKLNDTFSNIKFFEKNHSYTIDDEPAFTSVSGLIKKFTPEFNTNSIAPMVAKREHKTLNEVLEEWEFKKNYSCHKGSEFHLFVENFLERRKISIDKDALKNFMLTSIISNEDEFIKNYYNEMAKLISNFLDFYEDWKKDHVLIKSEFVIGDKDTRICGTIDNLSWNKSKNTFSIFDYKTNKEIKMQNPKNETLLKPFDHLQNCEYVKYSLQQCLYALIFEKNTGFKIDNTNIVWVGGNEYEVIKSMNLMKEADLLLNIINEQ